MKFHKPSWTKDQQKRLQTCLNKQKKNPDSIFVGYWCSDQWGRPFNGGNIFEKVESGLIQVCKGPLEICENGYHATTSPHIWRGKRVWVVALHGFYQKSDDKYCSLKREIIGEVLPEDVIDASIAVRFEMKNLNHASLDEANLSNCNLSSVDLYCADLNYANLTNANLAGAYLNYANLNFANLNNANLYHANLYRANLRFSTLSHTDLSYANLADADLTNANLVGANLVGAQLNLTKLNHALLINTNLTEACIGTNERPEWLPKEWKIINQFICR